MEKITKFIKNNSENFFFIAFGISMLSFSWFKWTESAQIYMDIFDKYRYYLAAIFLLLRYLALFITDRKYIYSIVPIAIIFLISAYTSKGVYLLQVVAILFATYKIDIKKILRFILIFFGITFLVLIINIIIGNIDINITQGRVRNYMGFKHPSYFSISILSIYLTTFYLYSDNHKKLFYLLAEVVAVFLWCVPNTRTSAIVLACFPFIVVVIRYFLNLNNKVLNIFLVYLPICFFVLSLILLFLYDNGILNFGSTFTARFSIASQQIQEYGIHLFKSDEFWADQTHLFLLLHFGIITTIVYETFFILVNKRCVDNNDYKMLSIAILFLIYGMMDNYGLNLRYNISLLTIFALYNTSQINTSKSTL